MAKKNERAQNLALSWVDWLYTRGFYGPPPPKHILAMLSSPSGGGNPPSARLSAEIAAFHRGVCSLPDDLGRPFIRVYCGWPELPIKTVADDEGINPDTYYERAHKGAKQALVIMQYELNRVENLGLLRVSGNHPTISAPIKEQATDTIGVLMDV